MAQLNGKHQCLVQGKENRYLHNHRQTAAKGVNLMGAIQFHDRAIQGLPIILVLLFQLGHFRLQLLHVLHGLVALVGKGEKENFDNYGDDDDRNAVVMGVFIENISKYTEKRFGNGRKPAQVKCLFQTLTLRLQYVETLGTEKETVRNLVRLTRLQIERGGRHRGIEVRTGTLFNLYRSNAVFPGENCT